MISTILSLFTLCMLLVVPMAHAQTTAKIMATSDTVSGLVLNSGNIKLSSEALAFTDLPPGDFKNYSLKISSSTQTVVKVKDANADGTSACIFVFYKPDPTSGYATVTANRVGSADCSVNENGVLGVTITQLIQPPTTE